MPHAAPFSFSWHGFDRCSSQGQFSGRVKDCSRETAAAAAFFWALAGCEQVPYHEPPPKKQNQRLWPICAECLCMSALLVLPL
mmetsp:Transcript_71268/g.119251  ORF Transcript_71268/g.119251 Transcript_71268/m.119251 type:complete len:83 (-) Transcript_71268:73-321(-)